MNPSVTVREPCTPTWPVSQSVSQDIDLLQRGGMRQEQQLPDVKSPKESESQQTALNL
jgi:hypothetical protein